MSIIKPKQYYEMSKEQYDELKEFYQKLGYSNSQVKKLSSECFGYEIRVNKSLDYSYNWRFSLRTEYDKSPFSSGRNIFLSRSLRSVNMMNAMPYAAKSAEAAVECYEDAVEPQYYRAAAPGVDSYAAAPMGSVRSAQAPVMGAMGMNISEYNTAETHAAAENELQSPLDAPQMIFSANVNTASWTHVRSMVGRGMNPNKDFVRIEELINSYKYKLDLPENNELFSISAEKSVCPWNKDDELLFIGLKGRKASEKVKQNLALLVDVSGSMEGQWILVQMSMAAIMSKLNDGDILSIISYSNVTKTVVKQINAGNKDKCVEAILSVEGIGGWTHGSEGLENAYSYLTEFYDKEANNRLFIFTDGDFNFGVTSDGSLKDFIYKKRKTGIYLSVVGYGENNFKDNKMETLAQNGNGNYTFVSNPYDILDNLWDKLISNLVTVAKDVKISVELNPKYVSEYRLIGYDQRKLSAKEFNDTEKAADGIGSEHNTVALIQYKKGKAEKRYSTRYVSTNKIDNIDEFAFVEVHYKDPNGNDLVMTRSITLEEIEAAKPVNIPAASLIAAFGLILRESEYKGAADSRLLSELLSEVKGSCDSEDSHRYSHFNIIDQYCKR